MFKYNLLAILSFCFISGSYGQQQLEHPKKYYINDKGKLFWNAQMPFYLFGATDSLGADLVKLKTNNAEKYANPLYFDTEGDNFFRARWAVDPITKKKIMPELEMMYVVSRDSYAPVTSIKLKNAPRAVINNQIYFGKGLTVSLQAKDNLSGVENIYYSLQKKEYEPYSSEFKIEENGAFNLVFYALDNTGNVEIPKSVNFVVDTVAPTSKVSYANDHVGEIFSPRTQIQLSCTDDAAGAEQISYKIDGSGLRTYVQPLIMESLKEGEHTVTFSARDKVGNKEHTNKFTFYLDKSAPKVTFNVIGEQYQNRGRVYVSERTKIELVAEDNKAGVQEVTYQIDGGTIKLYTEPFSLPKDAGTHIIMYYAKDKVGNHTKGEVKEDLLNKRALNMDMEPPVLSYLINGKKLKLRDTLFITRNTKLQISATDITSGVKQIGYKINGGAGNIYTSPFTLSEDGFYEVDYFATDMVNNRNVGKFYVEVDNQAPKITYVLSSEPIGTIELKDQEKPLEVYPKGIQLYLAAQDNRVDVDKIFFKINSGVEYEYKNPVLLSTQGLLNIKIRALDKLGNENSESFTVYINNQ